jgi:trigger factor
MENKTPHEASVKKLEGSRVEISASIPSSVWEKNRSKALKNLNDSIAIDGFRKGNIPENILVAKIGEMAVLEEMAELAVPKAYVEIVTAHKIDAIGKPTIQVTKLASGNPIEFKATTAVVPEVILPDYKKLSEKAAKSVDIDKESAVTDKDLDDAILRVRKMHASHEGHDHDKMSPEEHEKAIMANLPELTDEFVKGVGDFDSVPDFKDKLGAMLADDKKNAAREKRRLKIADALAEATKVELPDVMIESEVNRSESQFRADIERMGITLEDYLKHAKKTLEDARKEWRPNAEKKAKLQLILNEIAKAENIAPKKEEIEAEVAHIIEHYKDADRERAAVYAETVLTNEKVFEFLETIK